MGIKRVFGNIKKFAEIRTGRRLSAADLNKIKANDGSPDYVEISRSPLGFGRKGNVVGIGRENTGHISVGIRPAGKGHSG